MRGRLRKRSNPPVMQSRTFCIANLESTLYNSRTLQNTESKCLKLRNVLVLDYKTLLRRNVGNMDLPEEVQLMEGEESRTLDKHTVPFRRKLMNECERLASHAISHASIKHECVQVHVSDALPTCESKLVSVKLKNTRSCTCEYSQTNTRVLANELVSTRNQTCEYSQ